MRSERQRSSRPGAVLLGGLWLLCAACGDPPGTSSSQTGDGSGTETGDAATETELGTSQLSPPTIVGFSPTGRPGGLVYLLFDVPVAELDVAIGGVGVEPANILMTEVAGALYAVPDSATLGLLTMRASRKDDPAATDEVEINLVSPRFVDVAESVGLGLVHDGSRSPAECAQSHTGVAWGDYDDDGWPDIFVGNVGSGGQLHRNMGTADALPRFADVTAASGLPAVDAVSMAAFIDWDGDGDEDLFIGRRGKNRLFSNQLVESGEVSFEDVTAAVGLDQYDQRTMGIAFGDYDQDNDLDLYVVNHAYCFPQPGQEIRAGDHLYRNSDGVFVEQTHVLAEVLTGGVLESVGFSAAWVDVERDGDPDLIVINDDVGGQIGWPNALWRNDGPDGAGGWRFTDTSVESGIAIDGINGMGLALGDVNDDGFVDVSFTNIGANSLLLGDGLGGFVDISEAAGIQRGSVPWGPNSITWAAHLFDHDNDGDLDLYFSGGRIKGFALVPDAFFDNVGGAQFQEMTWAAGVEDIHAGKASALADVDRDGDWDITTTAWDGALRVYANQVGDTAGNHFVDVELRGAGRNRAAIGAIVELTAGGRTRTCFHSGRPSLGAGGERTCHFGLGTDTTVDAVRVIWPDGTTAEMDPPIADSRVRYLQGE